MHDFNSFLIQRKTSSEFFVKQSLTKVVFLGSLFFNQRDRLEGLVLKISDCFFLDG